MTFDATAVYSNGTLRLAEPLPLSDQQVVRLRIEVVEAPPASGRLRAEEFDAILEEIAADAPGDVPVLPADFSRADCYGDDRG